MNKENGQLRNWVQITEMLALPFAADRQRRGLLLLETTRMASTFSCGLMSGLARGSAFSLTFCETDWAR